MLAGKDHLRHCLWSQPKSNATEWAAIGSGAAAVAAAASWASVWQNRRERLAAQKPQLVIEVSEHFPSGKIVVQLHNSGGTARSVRFGVIEGAMIAYGTPQPTGIVQGGESRTIETELPPTPRREAKGWVSGVDLAARYVYVTSTKGEQKRYRLRWPHKKMTDERITRDLYKMAAKDLTMVGHKTTERR